MFSADASKESSLLDRSLQPSKPPRPPLSSPKYIVITPVRNEQEHLPKTIASMVAQTVLPTRWIIVDDGSKDETGAIADRAAAQYPWIRVVHRQDRGSRQAGSGVIAAFDDGFKLVPGAEWDAVVKFDGDLSFGPDFFERCLLEFELNPKLGMTGGTCCKEVDGVAVPECTGDPPFHVRGATKIYRRVCYEAIGGLLAAPGWDTVDEIKANMLGWETRTLPVPLIHHRPTGDAYGAWSNWVKNGLANYVIGYHPLFMACKCLRRIFIRPYVTAGVGLMCGFLKGYFKGIPQVDDEPMIRFVRKQQWRALTFRKNLWR